MILIVVKQLAVSELSITFNLSKLSGFVSWWSHDCYLSHDFLISLLCSLSLVLRLFSWLFVALHFVFVTRKLHYLFSVQLELNNFTCLVSESKINATNVFLNYWKPTENPLKENAVINLKKCKSLWILWDSFMFYIGASMAWFMLLICFCHDMKLES